MTKQYTKKCPKCGRMIPDDKVAVEFSQVKLWVKIYCPFCDRVLGKERNRNFKVMKFVFR